MCLHVYTCYTGEHIAEAPASGTFVGVISRESVRLTVMFVALNDFDICATDIQNAFLTAPCQRKLYTVCGPKVGSEHKGKWALIVRALYGLRTAGNSFPSHLTECMKHFGYTLCVADPDVWFREEKRLDGTPYYEYILLYVDDTLCNSADPASTLSKIDKYFRFKPGSMGKFSSTRRTST